MRDPVCSVRCRGTLADAVAHAALDRESITPHGVVLVRKSASDIEDDPRNLRLEVLGVNLVCKINDLQTWPDSLAKLEKVAVEKA